MSTNALIAIVLGCCLCSCLTSAANYCPERVKTYCGGLAGILNCAICIFVIFILATASTGGGQPPLIVYSPVESL